MKVKVEAVDRFERDHRLRLPFRFGVITVTQGIQAIIRVRIALEDGRTSEGVAAEALGAKWFEKSPEFSDAQNLDQLRQALQLAVDHYSARGFDTPFGLYAGSYRQQIARGAELGLNPLVASYGPATIAVISPASAPTPELTPKASASGRATMPTVTPAMRSARQLARRPR